jgi:hypothetical protein
LLNQNWYVTHTGLIRLANRKRCIGIDIEPVLRLSDQISSRFSFKATVYKSKTCRGFTGHGDADPSNVSALMHGAEMRIAETRAVNRAIKKAYGIGTCSIEEIGPSPAPLNGPLENRKCPPQPVNGSGSNGDANGMRVRDRLCLLIRQHKLDAELVKAYALDFCHTKMLRDASREQVEAFVKHLTDSVEKDRRALLSQLHIYKPRGRGAA